MIIIFIIGDTDCKLFDILKSGESKDIYSLHIIQNIQNKMIFYAKVMKICFNTYGLLLD